MGFGNIYINNDLVVSPEQGKQKPLILIANTSKNLKDFVKLIDWRREICFKSVGNISRKHVLMAEKFKAKDHKAPWE